jgi:trk system potassium uptake protein TrkH
MLLFYALEHGSSMAAYRLGEQYLAAFFQSVTLRTAGFNTIPIGTLGSGASMVMIMLMFIGGASGSTAGGIKVNTAAVIFAYVRSRFRGEEQVLLGGSAIDRTVAVNALLLFIFGVTAVCLGLLVLVITESLAFLDLFFETVSAFATVGLSRGITGDLSNPGRIVVSILMFMGRLGPLTLLTALGAKGRGSRVIYPEKEIMIG